MYAAVTSCELIQNQKKKKLRNKKRKETQRKERRQNGQLLHDEDGRSSFRWQLNQK